MYQSKKIVATVEARMTSTRLPGKVLLPLGGKTVLAILIERIQKSKYLDSIVIATTTNKTDDPIVELAQSMGVGFFRGSEEDVLSRVLSAARGASADVIVELTGDCPLLHHELIDRGIEEFFSNKVDYAANDLTPSYPLGLSVQVFPVSVLAEIDALTSDPIDRVHVSYYIYNHPERYKLHNWKAGPESEWPDLRITLDEQADYELLKKICEQFGSRIASVSLPEIISFLRNTPDLILINQHVQQKDANAG